MGFFNNNPVIEFFHRITRKPSTIAMWVFAGLICSSTFYLMFMSSPTIDFNSKSKRKNDK
ncbi:XXYS1_4_G0015980.mRNA.1.CDS.1 [Saccharomyces cerevisiae]|nr:XXYS1_4_G0015980.mRNA.1.CDS.1 [Saccharomyces cerevisiae]CAD6597699.1 EM14S01-3B_G0013390.mRNA.1.CDS.1 [Saccharomyces cerevisiae]CAI4251734.1 AMH_1a_G0001600.mRNA.1.CDS.1 [Saccharomyces cerevisiae]CAI4254226.1 CEI_1a_G0001460.mRNA.1.CDS.1 [Saccharomyces cerevisiae]CAI6480379.1 AMH_1a_G0001600.mRNA.1.CDS.1 [Saccharomyces cerevisiae]